MAPNAHYKIVFQRISLAQPPRDLGDRIEARIRHARIVQVRLHATLHGVLVLGALVALVFVVRSVVTEAAQSGLYDYVSLVLSDGTYLMSSWRQTILSIAETVPVMGLALTTGIILICINSLKRGSVYIRSAYVFRVS